jgi:hypothetical protein
MKLKNYVEGRPTILRHWPVVLFYPGQALEVQAQDLVTVRRASELFPAVYVRREILRSHSRPEPPDDYFRRHPKQSYYGVDKIVFYVEQDGRFYKTKTIDTVLVFGQMGKRLASVKV